MMEMSQRSPRYQPTGTNFNLWCYLMGVQQVFKFADFLDYARRLGLSDCSDYAFWAGIFYKVVTSGGGADSVSFRFLEPDTPEPFS